MRALSGQFSVLAAAALTLVASAAASAPTPASVTMTTADGTPLTAVFGEQGRGTDLEFITPKGKQPQLVEFDTEEGTHMNVTVSPKGDVIVFDLLAHLYQLPIDGGEAKPLTQGSGIAMNTQPQFSPDGRRIVFISDRSGQENVWIINADGTSPRPVYLEEGARYNDPAWSPDGKSIVVIRNVPSLGRGWHRKTWSLWILPVNGGKPRQLIPATYEQFYAPTYSPDGKYVYFHSAIMGYRGLSIFQYNDQVKRIELATGKIEPLTGPVPADPTRDVVDANAWTFHFSEMQRRPAELEPHIDPSGRYIAYAKEDPKAYTHFRTHTVQGRTGLVVRDLVTGEESLVVDRVTRDLSRAHAYYVDTQIPGHSWTPDGKSIVFTRDGKFFKVDVQSKKITAIPFNVHVQRIVTERLTPKLDLPRGDTFPSKLRQWPALSPDRKSVVFVATGRIWRKQLPDGATEQLAGTENFKSAAMPTWSADGSKLAFVSWDDEQYGALQVLELASGQVRSCSANQVVMYPAWEPSGSSLLVTARTPKPSESMPLSAASGWELRRIQLETCATTTVTQLPYVQPASVTREGRIAFTTQEKLKTSGGFDEPFPSPEVLSLTTELVSISPAGDDRRIEYRFPARPHPGNRPLLSPSGNEVLFESGMRLFAFSGKPGDSSKVVKTQPNDVIPGRKRLDKIGVIDMSWFSPDEVQFSTGPTFTLVNIRTGARTEYQLDLSLPRYRSTERMAITNARIVTMEGTEVIEKGNIIVAGDTFECVGACEVRAGDHVVDATGKTIIPGLIDVHAHYMREFDIAGQHHSNMSLALAHGVTSARDSSSNNNTLHPLFAELVAAGRLVGPRSFGTGRRVFDDGSLMRGDEVTIRNLDDAKFHVAARRATQSGTIKNFRVARRKQHQWLIEAARPFNMPITAEGAYKPLVTGFALDGQTGWEHPLTDLPVFADMAKFLGATKTVHTPTLTIIGWEPGTQTYYRPLQNLRADPVHQQLSDPVDLARRIAQTPKIRPKEEFWFPVAAEGYGDIVRAGGDIAVGEHGEQPGIGSHWEMWAFAEGMSVLDTLRCATMTGARFIGADDHIGSIKVGKLADLVILNSNILENIRASNDIAYVVKDGVIYDRTTLDVVWPNPRPYGFRPWARSKVESSTATGTK